MATLIIAEKPSVAKAIAQGLGNNFTYKDGYYENRNYIISWCVGHLIALADADKYDPALKKWSLEPLPFMPQQWQMVAKDNTAKQLRILSTLIKKAEQVINCGDPDREGQLLVDELFDYLKVRKQLEGKIQRAIITDLSPAGVRKAFANLKPNTEFQNLYYSALARSHSDWLLGINLSRAVTLYAQEAGFSGALSIGRVFTPLLAMVYHRDLEIENFQPHDYYQIFLQVEAPYNTSYQVFLDGQEQSSKKFIVKLDLLSTLEALHPQKYNKKQPAKIDDLINDQIMGRIVDDKGYITNSKFVEYLLSKLQEAQGLITNFESRESKEIAPLGYILSTLQQAAFNLFKIKLDDTLKIVQKLYEEGYVTYPRTDCPYINDNDFADREKIFAHLQAQSTLIPGLERLNNSNFFPNHKSRIWNSSKIENHSAIIPTTKGVDFARLSSAEQKIYQLIVQRYLVQFMAPALYKQINLKVEIPTEADRSLPAIPWIFSANSRSLIDPGWKALTMSQKAYAALDTEEATDENGNALLSAAEAEQAKSRKLSQYLSKQALTGLVIGDSVDVLNSAVETSQTSPPSPYNEATLLGAMTNIARHVQHPELKKILNDTDGLGTEATRATIIEKLFYYKYCENNKGSIVTTAIGRGLIQSLPQELTIPDTTAYWEKSLSEMTKGNYSYQEFIASIWQGIGSIFKQLEAKGKAGFSALAGLGSQRSSNFKNSKGNYRYKKGNTARSSTSKSSTARGNKKGGSTSSSGYKGFKGQAPF